MDSRNNGAEVRVVQVVRQAVVTTKHNEITEALHQAVLAKWGEEHWPAMSNIIESESGFRLDAQNKSSGACGLAQALPCSKLLNVCGSLYNLQCQVDWTVNYVVSHGYGNPINAWKQWNENKCAIMQNGNCIQWQSHWW